jgi:hypothetical protein
VDIPLNTNKNDHLKAPIMKFLFATLLTFLINGLAKYARAQTLQGIPVLRGATGVLAYAATRGLVLASTATWKSIGRKTPNKNRPPTCMTDPVFTKDCKARDG